MKVTKQQREIKTTSSVTNPKKENSIKKTNYIYKVYSTQEDHYTNDYYPSANNQQEFLSGNYSQNNKIKITTYDLSDYTTEENLEKIILIQRWWKELFLTKYKDNDYVNYNQMSDNNNEYVIETKKVELYKKINDKEFNDDAVGCSVEELRFQVQNLWNDENTISTTGSLFVAGNDNMKDEIIYSYEEEIKNLKQALMAKEEELYTYINNLNNNSEKNVLIKKNYNQWNKILIPSPVNELLIESYKYKEDLQMQNLGGFAIFSNVLSKSVSQISQENYHHREEEEEINQENYQYDLRASNHCYIPLEIQKVNELSIFNEYMRMSSEKLCQQLGGLMILGREQPELLLQKIDELRISCHKQNQQNQQMIQELDGLEIIKDNLPGPKEPLTPQSVNEMYIYSLKNKQEQCIQELDGLEIWGMEKEPLYAQEINSLKISGVFNQTVLYPEIVDNIEIARDYDMLLVKPVWNNLEIQGSGLNLLACPKGGYRNRNQNEIEEREEREEYSEYNLENIPGKIRVIVPIPENYVEKLDNFQICVADKFSTPICAENVDILNISKAYSTRYLSSFDNLAITEDSLSLIAKEKEKIIPEYLMENTSINIYGISKDWNAVNLPTKTTKMIVRGIQIPKVVEKHDQELVPGTIFDIMIANSRPLPELFNEKADQFIILPEVYQRNWNQDNRPLRGKGLEIKGIEKEFILKPTKGEKIMLQGEGEQRYVEVPRNWDKLLMEDGVDTFDILREPTIPILIDKDNNWNKLNDTEKQSGLNILKEIKKWNKVNAAEIEVMVNIIREEGMRAIPDKEPDPFYKNNWNELDIENESSIAFIKKVRTSNEGIQGNGYYNAWYRLDATKENNVYLVERRRPSVNNIINNRINWNKTNKAQRNTKFAVKGSPKQWRLDVDNGEQLFFIKDSSDDDSSILYNEDYNQNEEGMLKRGVRAQILRIKDEESSLSNSSEIDVLANVKISKSKIYNTSGLTGQIINNVKGGYSARGGQVIINGMRQLNKKGGCVEVSARAAVKNVSGAAGAMGSGAMAMGMGGYQGQSFQRKVIETTTSRGSGLQQQPLEVVVNNTRVINKEVNTRKIIKNGVPIREEIVYDGDLNQNNIHQNNKVVYEGNGLGFEKKYSYTNIYRAGTDMNNSMRNQQGHGVVIHRANSRQGNQQRPEDLLRK